MAVMLVISSDKSPKLETSVMFWVVMRQKCMQGFYKETI